MSDMSLMKIIHWCARQSIKNVVAKNVLNALSTYANRAGVARPSQRKLAAHTGYSERAVRMALALLETERFIVRTVRLRGNRSRASDEVTINLTREADPQGKPAEEAGGTSCRGGRNLVPDSAARDSAPTTFDQPREQPKDSSEAFASGTGEPAPGRKIVFEQGRIALGALGIARRTAGDVIAGWLRDADDDTGRVLAAIQRASEHRPRSPIPFITACLQPRNDHARATGLSELDQVLAASLERYRAMAQPANGHP